MVIAEDATMSDTVRLEKTAHGWRGGFTAMASPCEVLFRNIPSALARNITEQVAAEAWRVEKKFSRYRDDNIVAAINGAAGQPVDIDEETNRLLDYADSCWQLSDGMFDITSGVLRRAWKFDGSNNIPSQKNITPLLQRVGWRHLERDAGCLRMPAEMELDFGGIGKEYAVDRSLMLARQLTNTPLLVNFGGDIAAWCGDAEPWQVGLEGLSEGKIAGRFLLGNGALATSGDSRRFLLSNGRRYSHVLNPQTGWPVMDGPHSVTVSAAQCTLAGMLATLALLRGAQAEHFLQAQSVRYWCLWGDRKNATAAG